MFREIKSKLTFIKIMSMKQNTHTQTYIHTHTPTDTHKANPYLQINETEETAIKGFNVTYTEKKHCIFLGEVISK